MRKLVDALIYNKQGNLVMIVKELYKDDEEDEGKTDESKDAAE